MPENKTDTPQGPIEGSRCVAGVPYCQPATIRRVNEDGSFKVEFDVKERVTEKYWYGVTSAEISFDDARHWAPVFAQISPDGQSFARTDFQNAFETLGYQLSPIQVRLAWDQSCQKLFNVSAVKTENCRLDAAKSYQLFMDLGVSAKACAERLNPDGSKPYYRPYWNLTRMGGREPIEIRRGVTLEDAFAALGLTASAVDKSTAAFLQRFEQKQAVHLPAALVEMLQRVGVANAVAACHPNMPGLPEFKEGEWTLRRGMREQRLSGDYALVIMIPHQDTYEWAVVFDDGEDDARVYVRLDMEDREAAWRLTAPGIGMFFWDLAQTGLTWYQDTKFKGGKPVTCSDISLILES